MKPTMKKSLALLTLASMMTTGAAYANTNTIPLTPIAPAQSQVTTTSAALPISIQINGEAITESGYVSSNGKDTMLPLRAVAEGLGFEITWNQERLSADLIKNAIFTTVTTGEDRYTINKMFTTLGVAPELVNNKLYIPASFVNEVLHGTATVTGNSASISLNEQQKKVQATGAITAINQADNYTSIHIQGVGTEGLVLNVGKDTTYQMLDGTSLSFADLHIGMTVVAEHANLMTMSLPPQTPTQKITVLDTKKQADMLGTAGVIEEVQNDDNLMSLVVKGNGLTDNSQKEIVLQITDETILINKTGEVVEKSALVKGANVIGYYLPTMTKSLPPIGNAWKVVVDTATE